MAQFFRILEFIVLVICIAIGIIEVYGVPSIVGNHSVGNWNHTFALS